MFCVSKSLQILVLLFHQRFNDMSEIDPKILITGTGRGLGKFLLKQFSTAHTITRKDNPKDYIELYDVIIHCAANVTHLTWEDDIPYSYYHDNVFLTKQVVSIPHKRFVHISSIAAVPSAHKVNEHTTSPYGITKRISESIVKEHATDYLIIRPTGLLGKEMKANTFQKILRGESIALTADSIMNYVLYDDVLDLINSNIRDVVTLSANGSITMQEVAQLVEKDIKFGTIHFNIYADIFEPILKNSSAQNILKYIKKYEK